MPERRLLFKKTSSQKKSNALWRSTQAMVKYISRYQDEVGKEEENLRRGRDPQQEGYKPGPGGKGGGKRKGFWINPSTHRTGVLWAGGFFGNIRSPGKCCPRKQRKWIREFSKDWCLKAYGMPKRKNDGTRMVLAVSDKTVEELTSCGIPADLAIQEILGKGMAIYAEKQGWEAGDIGWLAGFHHDNEHLHLHVLLFPTTKNGEPLRLSNRNANGGKVRDDLTDITGAMNVAAEIYYQRFLPYRVQSPEVQLAWFKETPAPIPLVEDFRVENPLPYKYIPEDERKELRRKKWEQEIRVKLAKESLAIAISNDPEREEELRMGTPLKITGRETLLDKLTRLWIREKTKAEYLEAIREEEADVRPDAKNPKKAQRAIMLLETQMPRAKMQLDRIEAEIGIGIEVLTKEIEKNRIIPRGSFIKKPLRAIKMGWSNAKLGHLRWRLEKSMERIKEPESRSRILCNLHMAILQEEQWESLTNTEAGIEELRSFARMQSIVYQKDAQSIIKDTSTPESAGAALLKNLEFVKDAIAKAKKEIAWAIALKSTLSKIPNRKKTSKEIDFLTVGARLRLKSAGDEKEIRRARIILRGEEKTPLPATSGKTISEKKEGRSQTKGLKLLRLPKFLTPSKMNPIFESKLSEIREKPGQSPQTEKNFSTELGKEKDPLAKWKVMGEKASLQSIILELGRRKSKEKDTPS